MEPQEAGALVGKGILNGVSRAKMYSSLWCFLPLLATYVISASNDVHAAISRGSTK